MVGTRASVFHLTAGYRSRHHIIFDNSPDLESGPLGGLDVFLDVPEDVLDDVHGGVLPAEVAGPDAVDVDRLVDSVAHEVGVLVHVEVLQEVRARVQHGAGVGLDAKKRDFFVNATISL